MSVKNTGNKPTHFRQYPVVAPKSGKWDIMPMPEEHSEAYGFEAAETRYETGSGIGDRARPLCTGVMGSLPCVHSVPCPLHLMETEGNGREAD